MTASSIARRPGRRGAVRCFAAVLALFAVAGMLGLATWHDGFPHAHPVTHATGVDLDRHRHAPGMEPDLADPMHMAAHTVLQSIDVPPQPALIAALTAGAIRWAIAPSTGAGSIRPDAILRPPRG